MFNMFNEGNLRHPHHQNNPDYRKVITYSFYMQRQNADIKLVAKCCTEMIIAFNQKELYENPGYLEIYPTPMSKGQGYVIVDSTQEGCFPLILRPESRTSFHGVKNKPRKNALEQAIRDIEKKQQKIMQIIDTTAPWIEVEPQLEKIFNYSKPSNDPDVSKRNVA